MKRFQNKDVIDYYDQTEVHYRMFWGLDKSMGIHYGMWEDKTKSIPEAVLNTNKTLMDLGGVESSDYVLDAGCGVGGSGIFLAKEKGCKSVGITLSKKQVETAQTFANSNNVNHLASYQQMDYTSTNFENHTFDKVWAIESMQTAHKKELFFKEMSRVLKPKGRILIADCFKSENVEVERNKDLKTMLNGWAISDITSINEFNSLVTSHGFEIINSKDVTKEIYPSAKKIYYAGIAGMFGTKIYNLFNNATPFSKIHYKTGLSQFKALKKNLWQYHLIVCQKT